MNWTLSGVRENRRLVEVVGLLSMMLAAVALFSLLSYDTADPTWFNSQRADGAGHNWFGRGGATLAEALLQLLGVGAFLAPLVLAWSGWYWLRGQPQRWSYARVLGLAVLGLALCALVDLLYRFIAYGGERFLAGGYLGNRVGGLLTAVGNRPGALLLSSAAIVCVVILITGVSFVRSIEFVMTLARRGLHDLRLRLGELWAARRRQRPEIHTPSAAPTAESIAVPPPRKPAPLAAASAPNPPVTPPKKEPIRPRPRRDAPAARQASLPMEPGQRGYSLPPLELLNEPEEQSIEGEHELVDRANLITDKLQEFNVSGAVVAIHPGPVVTTFEFKPEAGVKYSKVTGMTDDLSLALKAESVRIDRMHGRATIGIEVPNRRQQTIFPRDLLGSEIFRSGRSPLTLALGKDISGDVFTAELERMPHLLIAGATGSGKSVGLNGMIASILYKATPDQVRFIMIDTKMIELGVYAGIPHLLIPVVTEPKLASTALKWAVREMEQRYRKLASVGVRNLAQFNELLAKEPDRTMQDPRTGEESPLSAMPQIVIVIDELADLMMIASSDVEESIMRLAQMARAVGIHLIIATQRPSVDVITGTIKANFPSRVAFRVSQRVDSRTIIDQQGAEHLLGRGDMLFLSSGSSRLIRLHGAYITEAELNRITSFLKKMADPVYDDSVLREDVDGASGGYEATERDEMYAQAVRTILQEGKCSITLIQRRLQLGYARAARIVDMMEHEGVVSPGEGSKPREILVAADYLESSEAPR